LSGAVNHNFILGRKMKQDSRPYRKETGGRIIFAGTAIRDITNTAIKDDTWTKIAVPSDINCKSILVLTRDSAVWKLSHLSTGARYLTIRAPLTIDFAGDKDETLFYAQSLSGNKILEVLFLD
jgi:hypothetical protein